MKIKESNLFIFVVSAVQIYLSTDLSPLNQTEINLWTTSTNLYYLETSIQISLESIEFDLRCLCLKGQ